MSQKAWPLALVLGCGFWPNSAAAEPTARPEADELQATRDVDAAGSPSALDVTAGPRAVHRDFSYTDQVAALFPSKNYPKLAPYRLALGPSAFLGAELFPGAFGRHGFASHLGVVLSYERAFATHLVFAQGTPFERRLETRASELFVGLKGRLPLDAHELSLSAGYGEASYQVLGDEAQPVVPDVGYHYVRIDGAARFSLGAPFVGLHAGTRLVQDSGALEQSWFYGAKTNCFEAGASVGYALTSSLEVVAGFDVIRYGFDFNPIPSSADPYTTPVAGGAIDQYLVGSLSLRYRLRPTGRQLPQAAGRDPL